MGLLDRARKLAGQHSDKVGDAIDKVAHVVDGRTGGKFTDKIGKGAAAAKDFVDGADGPGATEGRPGAAEAGPGAGEVGGQQPAGPAPARPEPPPTTTS